MSLSYKPCKHPSGCTASAWRVNPQYCKAHYEAGVAAGVIPPRGTIARNRARARRGAFRTVGGPIPVAPSPATPSPSPAPTCTACGSTSHVTGAMACPLFVPYCTSCNAAGHATGSTTCPNYAPPAPPCRACGLPGHTAGSPLCTRTPRCVTCGGFGHVSGATTCPRYVPPAPPPRRPFSAPPPSFGGAAAGARPRIPTGFTAPSFVRPPSFEEATLKALSALEDAYKAKAALYAKTSPEYKALSDAWTLYGKIKARALGGVAGEKTTATRMALEKLVKAVWG